MKKKVFIVLFPAMVGVLFGYWGFINTGVLIACSGPLTLLVVEIRKRLKKQTDSYRFILHDDEEYDDFPCNT